MFNNPYFEVIALVVVSFTLGIIITMSFITTIPAGIVFVGIFDTIAIAVYPYKLIKRIK